MSDPFQTLIALAEAYNIERSYTDDQGRPVESTPEAIFAVLQNLGANIERVDQAAEALRIRQIESCQRVIEPVAVAWNGKSPEVTLRLPVRELAGTLGCRLELESGEARFWQVPLADLAVVEEAEVEGTSYRVLRLPVAADLPLGYHQLTLHRGSQDYKCLFLAAPERAYQPPGEPVRTWGGFLPLYAVRSRRNWGAGDFTDLENLIGYVQKLGGGLMGTLPLMAAFLDEPFEPSPYSPASRLFFSEFYLDVQAIPELLCNAEARALIASREFQDTCAIQHSLELVDYRGQMALKRQVLELLAAGFFAAPCARLDEFQRFVAEHPRAEDYARFRAVCERQQKSWWSWPERQRGGLIQEGDFDASARRYHLYVQWIIDEQLRRLAAKAGAGGPGLYFDYPLGVNSDSYDVWRSRDSFAHGISAGAPPDSFFTKGQDWGFPPLHPENIRVEGYRYLRDCLQAHMAHAGLLRIDHMMGLHRFYWVPRELGPRKGAYVRYAHEELYAVYSLESNRHRTMLVGEDLGTVPPAVRPAMARHNIHRLFIGQWEVKENGNEPLTAPKPGMVASMNTHDMPPFASFWQGFYLDDNVALGIFTDEERRKEQTRHRHLRESFAYYLRQHGQPDQAEDILAVLKACVTIMGRSEASIVLVNFEDLWKADLPQNVPGTWRERPNWQRKALHFLEDYDQLPTVVEILKTLNRARRVGQVKNS